MGSRPRVPRFQSDGRTQLGTGFDELTADGRAPVGLSRYVQALSEETHQRGYDATLAVRCWRNLEQETGTATNLALRDRARAQLDRATLRGVALIVRQRFTELPCWKYAVLAARWSFLQTVVPLLEHGAREIDPAKADVLKAQVAVAGPEQVDVNAALGAMTDCFHVPEAELSPPNVASGPRGCLQAAPRSNLINRSSRAPHVRLTLAFWRAGYVDAPWRYP
jgi:hypothetical protein